MEAGSSIDNSGDLGFWGNKILAQLPNDFSKEMFTRYWTGQGNYKLSEEQFMNIFWTVSQNGADQVPGKVVSSNDYVTITQKVVNFRGTEYETVFGSGATLYYLNDMPYKIYDLYDFDPKKWGSRVFMNEVKTRAVHDASIMYGDNAHPFEIYY